MNDTKVLSRRRSRRIRAPGAAPRVDQRRGQESPPARGLGFAAITLGASARALRVSGEIDLASRDTLGTAVNNVLAGGVTLLLLDLTDVGFIDVAGLRAVAAVVGQCREAECIPVLLARREGPVERLQRLLERTGRSSSTPLADVAAHFVPEGR